MKRQDEKKIKSGVRENCRMKKKKGPPGSINCNRKKISK